MRNRCVFVILTLLLPILAEASPAGWTGDNWARLETFLKMETKNKIAVFDWDNTVIKNDAGDAVFFWMISHDLIHRPDRWASTSACLSLAALEALNSNCTTALPGQLQTSGESTCGKTIVSIYVDGKLADGKTPGWTPKCNSDTLEPAYAWAAQLMAGYTPDEIRMIAKHAIDFNLHNSEGTMQKLGGQEVLAWIRVYSQMKELIAEFQKRKFDVWIASATSQYIVEVFAKEVGVRPDHVIGVRSALNPAGKITSTFEGCGKAIDGNQEMITYRYGKRCWINKVVFKEMDPKRMMEQPSPIAFAAGDSDTDIVFLKDARMLRLAINRNKPELMCNALANADGKWLINPMFIDPKPRRTERYACQAFGIPDQTE